jgi:hypothetical protein
MASGRAETAQEGRRCSTWSQIKARLAATTPQPWWWEDWTTDDGPNTNSLVAKPETRIYHATSMFPDLANRLLCDEENECPEADKVFIAAAGTDIAALIEEVEYLRGYIKNER